MEADDYVSYTLAVKLKEAGFRWETLGKYVDCPNDPRLFYGMEYLSWNLEKDEILTPTLYRAQKWLRERKNIVVIAEPDFECEVEDGSDFLTGKWYFTVWEDGERILCNFNPNSEIEEIWMFEKYEAALSAGIEAALELLEKEFEK